MDDTAVRATLRGGESDRVEFKSSLRFPHGVEVPDDRRSGIYRDLEKAVAKTIAAFRNADGGMLLIGVNDDAVVLGIEPDFETLSRKKDRDGWWLAFKGAVARYLGDDVAAELDVSLVKVDGKLVAAVSAPQGDTETWLRDGDKQEFYVRNGPSSVALPPADAVTWIRRRFWRVDES
jgi:predicted HTH transcriptional regulator